MKEIAKTLILFMIILILGAPSCGDEKDESFIAEEVRLAKKDLILEFESDHLTAASLHAYEITAMQKLSDIADYLRILTDTSLDITFRVKAGELIKNTFLSDSIKLSLYEKTISHSSETTVKEAVQMGIENQLSIPVFTFDSIFVYEPLHWISNSAYAGNIRFIQSYSDTKDIIPSITSLPRNANFYVCKKDKIFGNDTLSVWSAQLGEIR